MNLLTFIESRIFHLSNLTVKTLVIFSNVMTEDELSVVIITVPHKITLPMDSTPVLMSVALSFFTSSHYCSSALFNLMQL